MSERRPHDFLIAVIATFVILGLLFWLFMLCSESVSRKFDEGKRSRVSTAHRSEQ